MNVSYALVKLLRREADRTLIFCNWKQHKEKGVHD